MTDQTTKDSNGVISEIAFARAAIMLTLSFLITVGNIFLLITLRRSAKKIKPTSKLFLASLSVADLFVGCIIIPSHLTEVFNTPRRSDIIWCQISTVLRFFNIWISCLSLMLFLFDRIFFIQSPLRYRQFITPRRSVVIVSLVWSLLFVISIAVAVSGITLSDDLTQIMRSRFCNALLLNEDYLTVLCLSDFVIILTLGVFYKRVDHVNKHQMESIFSRRRRANSILQFERLTHREMNKTKMMRYLIFVFCLCWTPSILHDILNTYDGEIVTHSFIMVSSFCVYSKSFFNCIVYYNFQESYKKNLWKVLQFNKTSARRKSIKLSDRTLSKLRLGLRTPRSSLLGTQHVIDENNNGVIESAHAQTGEIETVMVRTQTTV